jgi:hypothetical protein
MLNKEHTISIIIFVIGYDLTVRIFGKAQFRFNSWKGGIN